MNKPLLLDQARLDVILASLQPGREAVSPEAFFFLFEDPEPRDFDTRDGIAVIEVRRSFLRPRTYSRIRKQIEQAIAAQNVRGILLDIDSPGGEVAGLFDLADFIFEARGPKPIWAIANDDAFSAAYGIASGAERISVTRTGGIGSVGVIAIHVDYSKMDERVGVTFTPIYSGERKADYLDTAPLGDTARGLLQTEIDRLRELFVETVARNRGKTPAAIRDTEAGSFFGPGGMPLLADAVENIDELFEKFRTSIETGRASASRSTTKETTMAKEPTKETQTDEPEKAAAVAAAATEDAAATAADAAAVADVIDIGAAREQAHQEGAAEATKASAERTSAIRQACALARCPERFGEFLDSDMTAEQVGKKLLADIEAAGGAEVSGAHAAADATDAEPKISTAAVYASRK